jgi:hypothetical protein
VLPQLAKLPCSLLSFSNAVSTIDLPEMLTSKQNICSSGTPFYMNTQESSTGFVLQIPQFTTNG